MIRFFQVQKAYADGRQALSDVSFEVSEGELVVLWGPSGAGKSTLLQLVLGAEAPSAGQVVVGGQNIARLNNSQLARHRLGVGVVFQDLRLLADRSILYNVSLALLVRGRSAKTAREEAAAALEGWGLGEALEALPRELSGGEQQRVAIARALVGEPKILLVDEPTGSLDGAWAREVRERLADRARAGAAVILATHDPELLHLKEPTTLQPRILEIEGGRVREASGGEP